jgi:hypothetical protein
VLLSDESENDQEESEDSEDIEMLDESLKKNIIFNKKIEVNREDYLHIHHVVAAAQSSQITIQVNSPKENAATDIVITDMSGRAITRYQRVLSLHSNTLDLSHEGLASGMYVVSVSQGEQSDSRKVMIIR